MGGSVKWFKVLSILTGIIAMLVTLLAIGAAIFMGLMVSGNALDIFIAIWLSLSLGRFFLNAFLVIFAFSSFSSRSVRDHYLVFLSASVMMAVWNYLTFPNNIAYGYFAFWAVYSVFLVLNRRAPAAVPPGNEEPCAASGEGSATEGA